MFYTRKGDGGDSGLFGTTERLPKDHPIFEALGSVDELNSLVGLCSAYLREYAHTADYTDALSHVQESLFIAQAQLAGAEKRVTQTQVNSLEQTIERILGTIQLPTSFVVPGATVLSALFDYTRTVARRTERTVVTAQAHILETKELLAYLNRLSSFFYVLARDSAQRSGATEPAPTYDTTT